MRRFLSDYEESDEFTEISPQHVNRGLLKPEGNLIKGINKKKEKRNPAVSEILHQTKGTGWFLFLKVQLRFDSAADGRGNIRSLEHKDPAVVIRCRKNGETPAEECSLPGRGPVCGDPLGNHVGVGDWTKPSVDASGPWDGLEMSPSESWDRLQHLLPGIVNLDCEEKRRAEGQ